MSPSLSPTPPSTRTSLCIVDKFVTPLKEKFSLPISIFHSLLPHPQRELLVVSLKNLSPPSTRSSLCLVDSELNEHSPPQREVLFAYFNFSLSPPLPSTRTSRCIVEKFVTPLKEKFSLPISIFHSVLPHPQREVLFVSLTASSTSTPHLKEKFSLHISIFHSLLPYPQRELLVVSLTASSTSTPSPQREVLFAYFNFSLSPPPPSTRASRCIVANKIKICHPLKEKFSLPISIFPSL